MKAQIEIKNEKALELIKKIGIINGIDVNSKEKQINLALDIAYNVITSSDEDTLMNLANLKKTI
jgi:hypothetical protein